MKYVIGFLGEVLKCSPLRVRMLFHFLNKRFKFKYDFYIVTSRTELYNLTKSKRLVDVFISELTQKKLIQEAKNADEILARYKGKYKAPIVYNITPLCFILDVLYDLSNPDATVKGRQLRYSIYTSFIQEAQKRPCLPALLSAFNKHKKLLSGHLKTIFTQLIIEYRKTKS